MLHIHNGDSSAGSLKESGLAGEHLPFREILLAGPTPQGLSPAEWRATRASFLAANFGEDEEECRRNLAAQDEALRRFRDHDEVILWFEHDLFCQVHLIYLLAWFHQQEQGSTQLSLLCIGEFPGIQNFGGLGELKPAQMASLFDQRHKITDAEFALAAEAWQAYSSPDPTELEALLGQDTAAMPFLRAALLRHLARYPSTANGLGHLENRALQLITEKPRKFGSLFPSVFANADAAYGLGDAEFWNVLKRMGQAKEPPLRINGSTDFQAVSTNKQRLDASFELTEQGREVLAGRLDYIKANGLDLWLGGVHLTTDRHWRWDVLQQKLI